MAWTVSSVQSISLAEGLPDRPGFFIEQQGSSPTLTVVFEDRKTADECATAMKLIFDKAAASEVKSEPRSRMAGFGIVRRQPFWN